MPVGPCASCAESDQAQQIKLALKQLDANDEQSLLSQLRRDMATARGELLRAINPAHEDSPLALLRNLNRGKRGFAGPGPGSPATWQELDEWENRWFPIASATLQRRFPAVHAKFFLNLSQTEGPSVILSVTTFMERFAALTDPKAGYGAEGDQAKKLLETRGLNEQELGKARVLLEKFGKYQPSSELYCAAASRG
jgi:hypothetical protein